MIIRALDNNGDWTFGAGSSNFLGGLPATRQDMQTSLLMFLGQCFWDLTAGIDWFNLLGAKSVLPLNLAISSIILKVQFVIGSVQVSTVIDANRNGKITYSAQTAIGVVPVQGTIGVSGGYLLTQSGDRLTDESGNPLTT